jgi:hypothetical protein
MLQPTCWLCCFFFLRNLRVPTPCLFRMRPTQHEQEAWSVRYLRETELRCASTCQDREEGSFVHTVGVHRLTVDYQG